METKLIKANIRLIRAALKLSQQQFADKLGTSRQLIWYWESPKNSRLPSLDYVCRICKTYNVKSDWLLGLKGDR